ncbi:hypothetical protein BDN72DRAFT_739940, partial [Pluteus cervinus]
DPIALTRALVVRIRGSGQWRHNFSDLIEEGNRKSWWMNQENKVVKLKNLQLLRDCPTRWDSCFKMNKRFSDMRPVSFPFPLPWFTQYALTVDEWQDLEDLNIILSVPAGVQQTMSSDRTPLLAKTLPYFERFMTLWESLCDQVDEFAPLIQPGLDSAYKYYSKMDNTNATSSQCVLINPHDRLSHIKQNW